MWQYKINQKNEEQNLYLLKGSFSPGLYATSIESILLAKGVTLDISEQI